MSQRSSNCGGTFGLHHVVSAAAVVGGNYNSGHSGLTVFTPIKLTEITVQITISTKYPKPN